jgi:hypothetical protein
MPWPTRRAMMRVFVVVVSVSLVIALKEGGWSYLVWRFGERVSIADRVHQFAPRVDPMWESRCREVGLAYPPARVRLLGLKAEKRLEVYAADAGGGWKSLASFPVLAASGGSGPKLREGDNQVPEGLYRIALLNPNSLFHVSLRVDYPNADDREHGRTDGRDRLGGDIMIHGGRASIGCIAIGDPAIEEVFLLAERCGLDHLDVLILPHDLRRDPTFPTGVPTWMTTRYQALLVEAQGLPHQRRSNDRPLAE